MNLYKLLCVLAILLGVIAIIISIISGIKMFMNYMDGESFLENTKELIFIFIAAIFVVFIVVAICIGIGILHQKHQNKKVKKYLPIVEIETKKVDETRTTYKVKMTGIVFDWPERKPVPYESEGYSGKYWYVDAYTEKGTKIKLDAWSVRNILPPELTKYPMPDEMTNY